MSRSPKRPELPARREPLSTDAFWAFAVWCWSQPEARSRLLHWQDHHQIDVLLVLFACWLPDRRGSPVWRKLAQGSGDWNRRVTRRIRTLRRRIPERSWADGYRACLALEQSAERVEAAWLTQTARLGRSEAPASPALNERLRRLFPALSESEIDRFLAGLRS